MRAGSVSRPWWNVSKSAPFRLHAGTRPARCSAASAGPISCRAAAGSRAETLNSRSNGSYPIAAFPSPKIARPSLDSPCRGATPTAYARVLATRFGIEAIDAVHQNDFGTMVALRGADIIRVPLADAVRELKTVDRRLYDAASVFFG